MSCKEKNCNNGSICDLCKRKLSIDKAKITAAKMIMKKTSNKN